LATRVRETALVVVNATLVVVREAAGIRPAHGAGIRSGSIGNEEEEPVMARGLGIEFLLPAGFGQSKRLAAASLRRVLVPYF
jgi:hypothetical protein